MNKRHLHRNIDELGVGKFKESIKEWQNTNIIPNTEFQIASVTTSRLIVFFSTPRDGQKGIFPL